MLERLDDVPWGDLEHAYGTADDVPDLLRQLLSPDPDDRASALDQLYGNVFHQGTRFPAAGAVTPFLVEMVADPATPGRAELLHYWRALITGYFNVQYRPTWGDGEHLYCDGVQVPTNNEYPDDYEETLHQVYRASLDGFDQACRLLDDPEPGVRAGAAWVLACLPTRADRSVPVLTGRRESSGWVRAAIAFALGELNAAGPLRRWLATDPHTAVRCMAACQLARIAPDAGLLDPLIGFVARPIAGYEDIPGAGGKSTGDAAHALGNLPRALLEPAVPTLCDRLDQARVFDTIPLVSTLLAIAFPQRSDPVVDLTDLQRQVLTRLVATEEMWSVGNLLWKFQAHGLPWDRAKCAELLGARVANDPALTRLRAALSFADIGFLDQARTGILEALDLDPAVFERATAPAECWFLCARAFAPTDPDRARAAFRHAVTLDPTLARRVDPRWPLADLVRDGDFDQAGPDR